MWALNAEGFARSSQECTVLRMKIRVRRFAEIESADSGPFMAIEGSG
jgi:hypothetical protein